MKVHLGADAETTQDYDAANVHCPKQERSFHPRLPSGNSMSVEEKVLATLALQRMGGV